MVLAKIIKASQIQKYQVSYKTLLVLRSTSCYYSFSIARRHSQKSFLTVTLFPKRLWLCDHHFGNYHRFWFRPLKARSKSNKRPYLVTRAFGFLFPLLFLLIAFSHPHINGFLLLPPFISTFYFRNSMNHDATYLHASHSNALLLKLHLHYSRCVFYIFQTNIRKVIRIHSSEKVNNSHFAVSLLVYAANYFYLLFECLFIT